MKKSEEELEHDIAAYLAEGERLSEPVVRFKPCFKQTTRQQYDDKFEVLPPIGEYSYGFLVSEPWSHRKCHVTGRYSPTYQALVTLNGKYFISCEGITFAEWRALDPSTLQVV